MSLCSDILNLLVVQNQQIKDWKKCILTEISEYFLKILEGIHLFLLVPDGGREKETWPV